MSIKKTLVLMAVVAVAMAASKADANVYVQWRADAGFNFSANSSVGILSAGESAIAQLIWSPDDIANAADATQPNYVTGNDVFLASIMLTNNGGLYEDYALFIAPDYNDGGVRPVGGFIYGRIFEDNSPTLGEWYYVGAVVSAQNLDPAGNPPATPQVYNLNRDNTNGDAIDGAFGRQVVPEPASISLLVLGAAVLGLRRRRR